MIFVEGLRQTICVCLDFYGLCLSLFGNGRIFLWTLLWVCPAQQRGMTLFRSLCKSAHFLLVDTRYSAKKYAKLYFDRVVTLHGVSLTIVSHRGSVFVSRFWEQLQKCLGTRLLRSLAYHLQTNGQTKRVNQVLEDMLRACVISFLEKWDECLTLTEFSYNNSYQESIHMAPFEAIWQEM